MPVRLLPFLLALLAAAPALACPGYEPCRFAAGSYYAVPPPGWDGKTTLPTMLFFHGHGPEAREFATDPGFTDPFAKEGVLLIVPDSEGPGWGHPGHGRDELAFTDALRQEIIDRFAVDPKRLLVTGFSSGGILGLTLACQRGQAYAGFVILAGAYRDAVPTDCPAGPVNVLQMHGRADKAVPMSGTPPEDRIHLMPVPQGLDFLRRLNGCPMEPGRSDPESTGGLRCAHWTGCTGGRDLRFCLHPGGHLMPEGWVARAAAWLGTLAPAG